jgi:hypothetical protein
VSRRSPAHARSKKAEAKKARRNKRRGAQKANWLPDAVLDELVDSRAEIAAELELFDERITKRGWDFDDELSDDELAIWYFAPSQAEIDDESIQAVTGICLTAADGAEIVHLMFVGTDDAIRLTPDELFKNIDAIEAYRAGEARPEFN